MGGGGAEIGILEQVRALVDSRLRNDRSLAGSRYAQSLPYHCVVTVSYDMQEMLEALWTGRDDYVFRESRVGGVLVESLEYMIEYAVEAGVCMIPVSVQMGEELEVLVEYEDLALEVVQRINSKSN